MIFNGGEVASYVLSQTVRIRLSWPRLGRSPRNADNSRYACSTDLEELYQQADPERDNLCLYGKGGDGRACK